MQYDINLVNLSLDFETDIRSLRTLDRTLLSFFSSYGYVFVAYDIFCLLYSVSNDPAPATVLSLPPFFFFFFGAKIDWTATIARQLILINYSKASAAYINIHSFSCIQSVHVHNASVSSILVLFSFDFSYYVLTLMLMLNDRSFQRLMI